MISVALVPVGLTQFSHLYTGKSMDREAARELLDIVGRWESARAAERGDRWVYGSDELYLLAEAPLPDAEHYGDFPQIENGVGAVTSLRERVADGLARLPRLDGKRIGVVTGVSMAPLMPPLLDQLTDATGAHFELLADRELAVRPDHDHRWPAGGRRHSVARWPVAPISTSR